MLTQQAPSGVVGAAVQAARSAAGAMHDLGSRAVDAALDRAADAVRPTFEVVGRAEDQSGRSKDDAARSAGDGPAARGAGADGKPEEQKR